MGFWKGSIIHIPLPFYLIKHFGMVLYHSRMRFPDLRAVVTHSNFYIYAIWNGCDPFQIMIFVKMEWVLLKTTPSIFVKSHKWKGMFE